MQEKSVKIPIHVWYLETLIKPEVTTAAGNYELRQTTSPLPELNRFLYAAVGASCLWYMRLNWTWQQWQDYLIQENIETWIAYQGATPIGYFELERTSVDASTQIAYFGLVPEFIGKGLGRTLLNDAVVKAFKGSKRVWLHTCSLDHPSALPNYLSRGFTIYKEEDFVDWVPENPLQPWPCANKPTAPRRSDTLTEPLIR